MENNITLLVKTVYGRDMYYPHCIQSRLLADIAGTVTVTHNTMQCALDMGFDISIVRPDSIIDKMIRGDSNARRIEKHGQSGGAIGTFLAVVACLALGAFAVYGWLSLAAAVLS